MMFSTKTWTLMALALCCLWNVSSGCKWMRKQDSRRSMFQVFSNRTISMLHHMGGKVSRNGSSDLPENQHNHAFRLTVGDRLPDLVHAEDKLVFIWQTLADVERLVSSGSSNATVWDQRDLDTFMNDLFRQITELHQCVKVMSPASKFVTKVNMKMKLHFRHMKKSLKNQRYSASAWEQVRTAVLAHLQRLDLLAATM